MKQPPPSPFLQALTDRRDCEPAATWLERLLGALPSDGAIDDDTLALAAHHVNGPLTDEQRQIEQDPAAFVRFWREVANRAPSHPLARAMYADTLLLSGDTDAAVREMLVAFKADPTLIYRVSGEYRDLMERAGAREWAAYRALAIRAAELDDPKLHAGYIREQVRDLLGDVRDDNDLRLEVARILRGGDQ
jgi:hypothetical protein